MQEQRFLLVCISRLKSGEDSPSPDEQKTMTITVAEFHDAFPDMDGSTLKLGSRKR
ncbi:hypothetical protein [Escherichia coli]